jgi:hypothetical protein
MEGVDRAPLEGGERRFDEARLVERVGVDRHLHVHLVGDRQAVVDRRRRRPPVLVQLEADGAGAHLLAQRFGQRDVALAEEAEVHRERVGRFEHALDVPGSRRAGGGVGAGGRPGATAEHRRHPDIRASSICCGQMKWMWLSMPPAVTIIPSPAMISVPPPMDRHARLDVRIAGLADAGDAAALDGDVGLDDSPVVDDQRVGDHRVGDFGSRLLALPHAVADDLAAAELDLLAVDGEDRASTSIHSSVSARRTRSPTVGPNISA